MPAISFSSGTTVTGANGKIYMFNTSSLSIYKIQNVIVFRDASTETWEACKLESFSSLYAMLSQVVAIETAYLFSYYYADNVLYVFVATSVNDPTNKLVIKRKRHFKRVSDDAQKFDVFDHHFFVLVDYAEKIYASTAGRRATKETLKRVDEFEHNVSQNLEPI